MRKILTLAFGFQYAAKHWMHNMQAIIINQIVLGLSVVRFVSQISMLSTTVLKIPMWW